MNRFKLFALTLSSSLLLSACTGAMMHNGSMQGMEHGKGMNHDSMMASGTMSHTMPMSGTMPMDAEEMGMHHQMMLDRMEKMSTQMQGMMDGSSSADAPTMQAMMGEMDSMMEMMSQMHTGMMNGSMPMEDSTHMREMMGKMTPMMEMMQQMHTKMVDGSMPMDQEYMEKMQSHMEQMGSLMHEMEGMTGDSMPMTHTMPMSETMAGMDHSAMQMDPNKPLDAQFIDGMIIHHQGAVAMANEVLQKATHPELKSFAEAIISAQTQEISDMQTWRSAWYADVADTGGMNMGMGDMQIGEDASKPFDQLFLEAMISHHQGAIDMATMALQMGTEHEEIKTLCDAIIKTQQAEIEQMKTWLQEWYNQ